MKTAGLDIGSRTISIVECMDEKIVRSETIMTGADPLNRLRKLINGARYDKIVATGYGRDLALEHELARQAITEIRAFAMGSKQLFPDVRTLLDIGGQDSKVISIWEDGTVDRFEMNDRCAAGAGRFLESMSAALGMTPQELGEHALEADDRNVRLSSTCVVFAESEVVSMIGRGEDSRRVALGIHYAIAERIAGAIRRIGPVERFVFAGGVARNPCLPKIIERQIGMKVTIPDDPQIIGAYGAALFAYRNAAV